MKVLVIGGGLIGLSTAYFLNKVLPGVTVIDAGPAAASGASHANGGLLTPSMADPWNAPGVHWRILRSLAQDDSPILLRPRSLLRSTPWMYRFLRESTRERYRNNTLKNLRLALYSLQVLRALRSSENIGYGAGTSGTIKLFRDPDAMAAADASKSLLETNGVEVRVLDRAATVELEPALEPIAASIAGCLYFPQDETGDARRYCDSLAATLAKNGCDLRWGVKVEGWHREGRRIAGVRIGNELIRADAFVLAAGARSASLARQLGVMLPIEPAKGYSISVPMIDWSPCPRIGVVDDALHSAATPLDRVLRVAGTAEFAGFDLSIRPERIDNLRRLARALYPSAAAAAGANVSPWAGLRPVSVDGVPILSGTPIENLFVNAGHCHLGWTMAAGSGRLMADLITKDSGDIDLSDYALARFGSGR
jgi:D-amino-acid dehydrogenase